MKDLYVLINNEPTGPFALEIVRAMVEDGKITLDTMYAEDGMSSWEPLSTIIEASTAPEPEVANMMRPDEEIGRCEQLSESLLSVSTYAAATEWIQKVAGETSALPNTLAAFDQMIAAELANLGQEKRSFEQQSFIQRTFGNHDSLDADSQRISTLRKQREQLAQLVEGMQQRTELVPDSQAKRDLILKTIRVQMKELKIRKKEAGLAMTEIKQGARVASEGAGVSWIGFYNSTLAARQRRGIRHGKEEALQPYEDAKDFVDRQLIALEKQIIWLESFA
jgi:hypothetical protein